MTQIFSLLLPLQSLPQTPAGGVGGKAGGCGGAAPSMVNGAAVDHQDIRDGLAINTEHVSGPFSLIANMPNSYYLLSFGLPEYSL